MPPDVNGAGAGEPPIGTGAATNRRTRAGTNHSGVKRGNRAAVFQAIHALGPVARMELARSVGLNAATVSHIVDELRTGGLVREVGHRVSAGAGRRAVDLEIIPSARYAIGIDVARASVSGALVDLSGQIRERIEEPGGWRREHGGEVVRDVAERLLAALPPAERHTVVGVGLGMPSPVRVSSQEYLETPSGEWQDLHVQAELKHALRLPVHVDNNANTSTLAELWFGAGRDVDDFVLVNLSAGVGGGVVLGGELYRGSGDLAAELGHVGIDWNGPRCHCGNTGCLGMYVAVPRVLETVRSALAAGETSSRLDPDEVTLAALVDAAAAGDPLATRTFADVARCLAAAIVSIGHVVDPQLVLIGRDLSTAGDVLLEPLRAEVRQRSFPVLRDSARIEVAALPDAPLVGAAVLMLREFFRAPL